MSQQGSASAQQAQQAMAQMSAPLSLPPSMVRIAAALPPMQQQVMVCISACLCLGCLYPISKSGSLLCHGLASCLSRRLCVAPRQAQQRVVSWNDQGWLYQSSASAGQWLLNGKLNGLLPLAEREFSA